MDTLLQRLRGPRSEVVVSMTKVGHEDGLDHGKGRWDGRSGHGEYGDYFQVLARVVSKGSRGRRGVGWRAGEDGLQRVGRGSRVQAGRAAVRKGMNE